LRVSNRDFALVISHAYLEAEERHRRSRDVPMSDLISIIVSTYNRVDALDAVLRSLSSQSDRGFEVVVADDGSTPATAQLVHNWTARMPGALRHVWQEDRGFRLAEIRNRAILSAAGRYCIFLDGDSIARGDFVAAHRRLAEPGWFVTGNRILMSRELTERILRGDRVPEDWGFGRWIAERGRGGINRLLPIASLPLGPLRKIQPHAWHGARSCNLAVWRDDLDRVDGFDAIYSGWGLEDSDLAVRLIRSGTRRKDGRFATGVLHLWHAEQDRSGFAANDAKLQVLLGSKRVRANKGLTTLAASGAPQASAAPGS
jgi:glycosyltransferase involved in cell wall biosynthesis